MNNIYSIILLYLLFSASNINLLLNTFFVNMSDIKIYDMYFKTILKMLYICICYLEVI